VVCLRPGSVVGSADFSDSWYDTTPTQPPTRTFSLYCHPSHPLRGNIKSACVAFVILGPHMVVVLPRRKHQRPILVPKPRGRSHLLKRIAPRQKEALLSTDGRVPQQFDPITPIVLAAVIALTVVVATGSTSSRHPVISASRLGNIVLKRGNPLALNGTWCRWREQGRPHLRRMSSYQPSFAKG
jgi:hypothetical protein